MSNVTLTASQAPEGSPTKSGGIAYEALVLKERLGVTNEEVAEQIVENPYLQYFLSLHEFHEKPLFDPSMVVHFRARFDEAPHQRTNDAIIRLATPQEDTESENNNHNGDPTINDGKLLIAATCTPADVTYPTDLKLLGDTRQKTEEIIDTLHAPFVGKRRKPRTRHANSSFPSPNRRIPASARSANPSVSNCATWTHRQDAGA